MKKNRRPLALALCLSLAAASAASANGPAYDQLTGAAPNGDMSGVTGETQQTAPGAVTPGQPSTTLPPDPSQPPAAPAAPAANVPSVTDQPPAQKSSFMSGVGNFFKSIPINQVLAGAAIGGAIGTLLLFATPVGWLGGLLIGAAIGAVLGSGLISTLFHSGGTGGS